MNHHRYQKDAEKLQKIKQNLNKFHIGIGETIFMMSFIINFIMGKVIHLTSSNDEIYNYYNDKNNIINQIFVKRGWFWTTLVVFVFHASTLYHQEHPRTKNKPISLLIIASVMNYVVITLWWILFTQWCFGLPIMDKVFVATGGKCIDVEKGKVMQKMASLSHAFVESGVEGIVESNRITSKTCRQLRGNWTGGHDPSGHVFILIHASLYMFFEISPYWISWKQFINKFVRLNSSWKDDSLVIKGNKLGRFLINNPVVIVMMLIGLWWFMLLMTNIYFHSIGEKLVGLMFGYVGIVIVYYVPRWKR